MSNRKQAPIVMDYRTRKLEHISALASRHLGLKVGDVVSPLQYPEVIRWHAHWSAGLKAWDMGHGVLANPHNGKPDSKHARMAWSEGWTTGSGGTSY